MKTLLISLLTCVIATLSAQAVIVWDYGWEDGTGTALGTYGNANVTNSDVVAHTGTRSLEITEAPISSTPQTYVWWVTGLQDGDGVTASFYCYDVTPGSNPSGRIWGHYTDGLDVNNYAGSAGGNSTYSDGSGWSKLEYTWIFDGSSGHTGLVVEARIYSGSDITGGTNTDGNVVYYDDASIIVSNDTAVVYNAAGASIPEPAMLIGLCGIIAAACAYRCKK